MERSKEPNASPSRANASCSIRPPRILARSPTILSPSPGFAYCRSDPLSDTSQFTTAPERLSSTLISPSPFSKHACRAALVTSSWTIKPNCQQRSDSSGNVSAAITRWRLHAIQCGSAHRQAEPAQIFRSINEHAADRNHQRAVDVGIFVEEFNDAAQRRLNLFDCPQALPRRKPA